MTGQLPRDHQRGWTGVQACIYNSQVAATVGRSRISKSMNGLKPSSRKVVASLLLGFLTLVSVTSSVCPVCDRIEQSSTQPAGVHSADLHSTSDCDRDGCSCCGFQFVPAFFPPAIALSEFTAVPKALRYAFQQLRSSDSTTLLETDSPAAVHSQEPCRNTRTQLLHYFGQTRRAIEDRAVLFAFELGNCSIECGAVSGIGRPRGESRSAYRLDTGDTHASWLCTVVRSHAVGSLWALSYAARKTLVFDAGFNRGLTKTSTRWEAFVGFTYLLPHRLW
jgi:hypothetical protein